MHGFAPFLPWLGLVLALGCLWGAFRAGRKRRLLENLPTSKTTGVFIGLVEVKGTAESAQPLVSYLAQTSCVHYAWKVEEHWSRTVTESYTDSKGRRRTRTRRESGWKTVAHGGEVIPFYVQDDCGVLLVRPEGAKIEPATVFNETCGRMDPLYYSKGPSHAVMHSDHRRRFSEQALPLHVPLYVFGQARERQDIVAPEIASDDQAPMFLISTRSEAQVTSGFKWSSRIWIIVGLLLAVLGLVIGDSVMRLDPARRWPIYLACGAGFALAWGLSWVWMVYNSLVDLRQRMRRGWSHVEVQLKRRHDLIPNLLKTVQGYRDYEQTLQQELAALRAQMNATPPGEAGDDFRAVHQRVTAIVERYPELKANESFGLLQQNLIDTEQRIALARGYFNEIATQYNTRIETVPDRFVARLASMKPRALMAANDFERAPVKVELEVQG